MADKITVADALDVVEVDLWGETFTVRPATKAVLEAGDKAQEQYIAAVEKAETTNDVVKAIAELLDYRLKPTDGKRTKASTLLLRKWDSNELTMPQLEAFRQRITEVADAPPT